MFLAKISSIVRVEFGGAFEVLGGFVGLTFPLQGAPELVLSESIVR